VLYRQGMQQVLVPADWYAVLLQTQLMQLCLAATAPLAGSSSLKEDAGLC
jgi:hypothetical protein